MAELSPLATAIGLGLLALSAAAWVVLAVQGRRGSRPLPETGEPQPNPHWVALLMTALSVGLSLVALTQPKPTPRDDFGISNVQSVCSSTALLGIIVVLPILLDQQTHPRLLGFHSQKLGRQFATGVFGYALAFAPVAIVYWLTASLRNDQSQHQLLKLIQSQPTFDTLLWVVLAAVVCAPLVEELLYRVILQSALRRLLPRWVAISLTALVFATVHRWPDAVPLLPLALVLGAVYDSTRSYWSVVVLHVLFNATNILLLWLSLPS